MITPFTEKGEVDFNGLEAVTDYLANIVDGLFVTGSYGSGALMNVDERKAVTEMCVSRVSNRVPTIPMVGTTNTKETVDLAQHAESVGAAAVAAVGPYYFRHDADTVLRFFEALVSAVAIPVYVYNNPKFQGYEMSLDTILRMKELGVAGIKDATFDIIMHADYQRRLAPMDFDVVLGTEAMWLPARALGCEAFIPGLGNAFPELCVELHRSGMAGDWDRCRQLQFNVNRIRDIMYHAPNTQLAVYAMLELRGILTAFPRAPLRGASESQKRAIERSLSELGLLP